ncbi:MAG: hypothetical protein ACSHW1_19855 [Yoonia sp.]|uniref:hypothetical protein n=1 Tax=Yoonia sp. TaxID=2212373 RepID=UPI003EF4982A
MAVLRHLSRYLFPDDMGRQMMAGALLPLAFVIPVLLAQFIWPEPGGSDYWKVASIFSGAVLFCCLMGFYKYFALLLPLEPDSNSNPNYRSKK